MLFRSLLRPISETLNALGVEDALVVHGSGLDEIALHAFTQAVRLKGGEIEELEITPEQAGLKRLPLEQITGGSPELNAERLAALLSGRGSEADVAVVALNAGALLATANNASDFREGVGLALEAIESGRANRLLMDFVEASND